MSDFSVMLVRHPDPPHDECYELKFDDATFHLTREYMEAIAEDIMLCSNMTMEQMKWYN